MIHPVRHACLAPFPEGSLTRVLVTDGEQRSSLAVVRSLGAAGHEVAVCSSHRRPIAGASRFCARTFAVANPQGDAEAFTEGVLEAVRAFDASVLIPMTDGSVPLLLEAGRSVPGLSIPFPELADFQRVSDKGHLMEVAAGLGVPVPEQVVLEAKGEARAAEIAALAFPLVLKPARSVVDTPEGRVRVVVRIAEDPADLEAGLESFPAEAYPILVQRKIVGPGLGVFLLAWDGKTIASFAHRRIREKPPSGGVSVYRESIAVRPDLLAHSERILEHFRWRGVAMVEFKEEAATGVPYLMEVNGRFWGSLQLAIDAGVDFPQRLLECLSGGKVEPVGPYRVGIRSRWLWGDVDNLIAVLRASPAERAAHPGFPTRSAALAGFLVPWRPGDRFEVLRVLDPLPFLAETANWFGALRRG